MFGLFKAKAPVKTMDPREVNDLLARGAIALVDVREPGEYRAERIRGAINLPLSRFEAEAGTLPKDKAIVLHCLSGARSQRALGVCARLGLPIDTHMAGGISAWKARGLPVQH